MNRRSVMLRALVALVSLAALLYLGREHLADLDFLSGVAWVDIAGLSALYLASHAVVAAQWQWALRVQGHESGFNENFLLTFLRTYCNLLLPWAGSGTVAFYLKRRMGVAYATYVRLLWDLLWIGLMAAGAVAVIALCAGAGPHDARFGLMLAMVGLVVAAFFMVRIAPRLANFFPRSLGDWVRKQAGTRIRSMSLIRLSAFGIVLFAVRAARTWLLFLAIGMPVSAGEAILLTVIADSSILVNITPNGIGIREAAISITAAVLGYTPATAVAAAVLDRLIFTLWIVVFGQVAIWKFRWHGGEPPREERN